MFNVKEHTKQTTLVFRLKEIHMLHILVNICAYFRMTFRMTFNQENVNVKIKISL